MTVAISMADFAGGGMQSAVFNHAVINIGYCYIKSLAVLVLQAESERGKARGAFLKYICITFPVFVIKL